MALSTEQIKMLLKLVASVRDDSMDCDGCFGRISEFVESQLENKPLSETLRAVETHLKNCPCCEDEYRALREGLRSVSQRPRE